jgi:hypothetical protein
VAVMSTIPGHNRVTQSRNQTALGGHGRTRRIGIRDPGSLTVPERVGAVFLDCRAGSARAA